MQRKEHAAQGAFCWPDQHLRIRKGTNLGAGNPSPAPCSASSRCQPCAPLARLKKYFQSVRANPSTSTLPQDGACQREALGARSALISHLAKQGQGRLIDCVLVDPVVLHLVPNRHLQQPSGGRRSSVSRGGRPTALGAAETASCNSSRTAAESRPSFAH